MAPTKIPKPRAGQVFRKRISPAGAKPTRIPRLLLASSPNAPVPFRSRVLAKKERVVVAPAPNLLGKARARAKPAPKPPAPKHKAPPAGEARKRLALALKRVIVDERTGTLEGRIRFAKMVRRAIDGVQPCLQQFSGKGRSKFGLVDKAGVPVVQFGKGIGSGVYGDAFVNTGARGIARLLRFSTKISPSSTAALMEGRILRKMSKLAERGICQNMPITYKVMVCTKGHGHPNLPPIAKQNAYVVALNELADGDLFALFKTQLAQKQYESIVMQIALALHAFHGLGYSHNDAHLGNFLYHRVKPGGYWRYNVRVAGESVPIFVPNRGHLVVLWDPGMAADVKVADWERREGGTDLFRSVVQMNSLDLKEWAHKRLKPIPAAAKQGMKLVPLVDAMQAFLLREDPGKDVLLTDRVFEMFVRGIREGKWLPSIRIGKRLRLPVRRLSMGRGSAGKVRTPGGRTAMKTRTLAPRSLSSRILNPAKAFRRGSSVSSPPYGTAV